MGAETWAVVASVIGDVVIGGGVTDRDSVTSVGGQVEPGRSVACQTLNGRPIGGGIASSAVSRASVAAVVGQVVIGVGVTDRDSVAGVGS